jgi:hypothetical protein
MIYQLTFLKLLLLFLMTISTNTYANNLFELKTVQQKNKYIHSLIVIDSQSQETIKEIDLSTSNKTIGLLVQNENSPFIYFYSKIKKNKARIEIINKEKLLVSHNIFIDEMTYTNYLNKNHYFFEINNINKLLIQVGKRSRHKLLVINGETGKIDLQVKLEKNNTLLKRSVDKEYIWSREANFSKKNKINIYHANNFKLIDSLSINPRIVSILQKDEFLFITQQLSINNGFKRDKFSFQIYNMKKSILSEGFISSVSPIVTSLKNKIFIAGRSVDEPKYFKLAVQSGIQLENHSNKSFDIDVRSMQFFYDETSTNILLFGKSSVGIYNLENPDKSIKKHTPYKIDGGIMNSDKTKVYFTNYSDAKVGMVDFSNKNKITTDTLGSEGKKVGLALLSFAAMSTAFANGYVVIPGSKVTTSSLMLNIDQSLLFALNSRTNEATIFNAKDLSNKTIHPIGRGAFMMLQASSETNLPVAIVGKKRVSFIDSSTGDFISSLAYDKYIKVDQMLNLHYEKNYNVDSISLTNIESIKSLK